MIFVDFKMYWFDRIYDKNKKEKREFEIHRQMGENGRILRRLAFGKIMEQLPLIEWDFAATYFIHVHDLLMNKWKVIRIGE